LTSDEMSFTSCPTRHITGSFQKRFSQTISWPVQNTQPAQLITLITVTELTLIDICQTL